MIIAVATEGIKDKDDKHYIVPPASAQARMSQAERTAFNFVIAAVMHNNPREIEALRQGQREGDGPLAIVEMHTMLRVLTKHLLTLRFSTKTEDLCSGKLSPPTDPSWDEQHGKVLYEYWWLVSSDFVKSLTACKK